MAPSLQPPAQRWSTDAVPPAQRLDYWVGAISEGFLAMDAGSPVSEAFHSELLSLPLGPVGVNRVRGAAQQVWRTRRGIARSGEHYGYLLANLDSAWVVEQDGRRAQVAAGDVALVDSRRPYHFDFPQGPSAISLELPLPWLTRWADQPEAHGVRPLATASPGWGAALAAFVRPWDPAMAAAPPLPSDLLTDQLGALLALACGDVPPAVPADTSLHPRIVAQLRQRLAEPGLTAAHVAAALGVSVRSLHRAMAAQGQTFARQLMAERMAVARQMLASPALRRVPASEIGRRVGLLDPSHFSRLCQRWLGALPSALRPR